LVVSGEINQDSPYTFRVTVDFYFTTNLFHVVITLKPIL
jgi:hypothetical protein